MQRKCDFAEGEYYHLYSRGVEKRNIFVDNNDRRRFLSLLYFANGDKPIEFRELEAKVFADLDMGKKKVAIGAYVLMPNHFHILIKEITKDGISLFMKKLMTAYSMYFNKRHARSGPLFAGRFKAEIVDSDEYLKYLFSYIHLNPVKLIDPDWKETKIKDRKKAEQYLLNYFYSSYTDYLGIQRDEKEILRMEEFPEYFESGHEFKSEVQEWLDYGTP